MQFKRKGNKIQVIAYTGYDKEKRRSTTAMVGSLDAYSFAMSDGLKESLAVDQLKDVQAYIEKERQSRQEESRQSAVKYAASSVSRLADSVAHYNDDIEPHECMTEAWAVDVYAAIDELQKQLRKAGYTRPKVAAKPAKPSEKQDSLPL